MQTTTMPLTLQSLSNAWIAAKDAEASATEARRKIEDKISDLLGIPEEWDGSKTLHEGKFKLAVKRTMTKKVDGDVLQEVSKRYGLDEYLPVLFRWKPEINLKVWKSADETITKLLAEAITTAPGRISYKIEEVEE